MKFFIRHKRIFIGITALIAFAAPTVAFAQGTDPETTKLLQSVSQLVDMSLKIMSSIFWPVLLLIGSLLDNELIFGGAMGERLLDAWVQMRNIVNVIFVLILLAIALYNVLGLGEEGGMPLAFKTAIPKFVLALIAVNFSYLAIKVVLDFTNVMTGAVFMLPTRVINQEDFKGKIQSQICASKSGEMPLRALFCSADDKLNARGQSFFNGLNRNNVTIAYAINFGRMHSMKFITDGLKDLGQLGFNIIFNLVLFVVYALSFIALFIVLLFRVVAAWIAVVLSPFLALTLVLPQLKEFGGVGGDFQSKFVKTAIAPVVIGLVLSIGYIMLHSFGADKGIHGEILSSSTLKAIDPNAIPTNITDLHQLMLAVGVIGIVWMGVFGATKGTFAEGITGKIQETAQGFGKFTAKLPMYLQAIPTGGKFGREKITPAEMLATLKSIPTALDTARGSPIKFGMGREARGAYLDAKDFPSVDKLGRTIGQYTTALKSHEGYEAVIALAKKEGLDDKASREKYGHDHNDPKFIQGVASNAALMKEIQKANPDIKDRATLEATIETGGTAEKGEAAKPKERPPTGGVPAAPAAPATAGGTPPPAAATPAAPAPAPTLAVRPAAAPTTPPAGAPPATPAPGGGAGGGPP